MIRTLLCDSIICMITLAAVLQSGSPFRFAACCGLLMVVTTADHIAGSRIKPLFYIRFFITVIFAVMCGQWYAFLLFILLPVIDHRALVPMTGLSYVLYMTVADVAEGRFSAHMTAVHILELMIMTAMSFIILMIFSLIDKREEEKRSEEDKLIKSSLQSMKEIRKNKELLEQSYYIDKNARLIERENISRNIHNSVGHSITAAIMTLDAADTLFDKKPEEARRRMNEAGERIRGSLESIRSAVRALDADAEDISVRDMICYMDNILNEFMMDTERQCDRKYDLYSESLMLPAEHVEFLCGALSEFLTNGVRHGGATHFTVILSADSSHIRLETIDNGRNDFSEDNRDERIRNGFGLKKLASYAERCGGSSSFSGGDGFRSVIELPGKKL